MTNFTAFIIVFVLRVNAYIDTIVCVSFIAVNKVDNINCKLILKITTSPENL